jgi:predicted component of viral defense system (DUF524 family)
LNSLIIKHSVNDKELIEFELRSESSIESLYSINLADAIANGESPYQIKEGFSYEYVIDKNYFIQEIKGVVSHSKFEKSKGRITPGLYVGTLTLDIINIQTLQKVSEIKLEVRSVKTEYRLDYRIMLEEITEKCADLLLQPNSPVSQYFSIDFSTQSKTLYQRFAFIKSILESDEFQTAVHKFLLSPTTNWAQTEIEKDIRGLKKISNKNLRQIATSANRIAVPSYHGLKQKFHSIPDKIKTTYKKESLNTPENRFIKYALLNFLNICSEFRANSNSKRLISEASLLEQNLMQYLSHSVFNEISFPNILPLNNPVLQRKEGYREIFRVWLMFDLAAKLIWHGGDDIYSANKRDVAILYEYWLFFKLLDVVKEVFKIDSVSIENLIESTSNGLALKLKQGQYLPIKGVFKSDSRILNVEFSYNRTFSGDREYPNGGSWTKNLRPDYTLSVWPFGIEQNEAEEEEVIVHIHFDAKYRVEDLITIFGVDESVDEEKEEQLKGSYKRADLMKMHTYRDAIRRTGGAYILYPGTDSKKMIGFHELLPGLGAFAIRPSKSSSGLAELKIFLYQVVEHFLNRASQREKMSLRTYEIYKENSINNVQESLPEAIGINRLFNPDDVNVLIAFYKGEDQLDWILKNSLYNTRTGSIRGSIRLDPKTISARYLLLHSYNGTKTGKFLKLKNKGPRIFSKDELISKEYPEPHHNFYLVYEIEGLPEKEFEGLSWDIANLRGYLGYRNSSIPFSVSITELMAVIIK